MLLRSLSIIALQLVILCSLVPDVLGQKFDHFPDRDVAIIPFEMHGGLMLVNVKFAGLIPMKFIWDTGAQNVILFERFYAEVIGAEYDMRLPILGSSLISERFALVSGNIRFGFAQLPPVYLDILVLEDNAPQLEQYLGTEVHGILGSSFFKNYILEIDYKRERILLHKYEEFNRSTLKSFEHYSLDIHKSKPYLRTSVQITKDNSIELNLLMDTGADINLLLHANTDSTLTLPDSVVQGNLGIGLSGELLGYLGRIHRFDIGGIRYVDMISSFQDIDSITLTDFEVYRNGIIGNRMLKRFDVIIDYPGEQLYLRADRKSKKAFKYDRSGLSIIALGPLLNKFEIKNVLPGSPAAEAGLKAGDQVLKLQCWPKDFYKIERINTILKKKAGKRIRMKVRRGDQKLKFRFTLRDLI